MALRLVRVRRSPRPTPNRSAKPAGSLRGIAMAESKTIVIVGGGFAGTTLARALDGKLPDGHDLVLISEESHTTFNPVVPEAVGASIFPEQVVAPIREMLRYTRFIMGRM